MGTTAFATHSRQKSNVTGRGKWMLYWLHGGWLIWPYEEKADNQGSKIKPMKKWKKNLKMYA